MVPLVYIIITTFSNLGSDDVIRFGMKYPIMLDKSQCSHALLTLENKVLTNTKKDYTECDESRRTIYISV